MRVQNDHLVKVSLLFVFVLLVCHAWQVYDSGFRVEPMIRVFYCVVYLAVVPFAGRKALLYILPAFALSVLYFNKFQNYTSFFIICLTIIYFKKYTIFYLVLYVGAVIASLLINDLSASHCLIHFINCGLIYVILNSLSIFKTKKVCLNKDESAILEELAAGKEIKAIDSYSKNTIFKYLKSAREKAGKETNGELLHWYIHEYKNGTVED